jgi:hypothetical protein
VCKKEKLEKPKTHKCKACKIKLRAIYDKKKNSRKPWACPWCGLKPKVTRVPEGNNYTLVTTKCVNKECVIQPVWSQFVQKDTIPDFVAWNTRKTGRALPAKKNPDHKQLDLFKEKD